MNPKSLALPAFMLFLGMVLGFTGCTEPAATQSDSKPRDTSIVSMPPTTLEGPGGPAFLAGAMRDFIHPTNVVWNAHLYLLNSLNYNDTIASGIVSSENAAFLISDLPEITADLIVVSEGYFWAKMGKLQLDSEKNALRASNRAGLVADSTILLTSVSDSVGRPDMPSSGMRGYIQGLVVRFKTESPDSVSWGIVKLSSCDTISVYRYDDPVFDPEENDVYVLRCESLSALPGRIAFFDSREEVKTTGPVYLSVFSLTGPGTIAVSSWRASLP